MFNVWDGWTIYSTKRYKEFIVPNEEYENKSKMAEKMNKRMFINRDINLFTKVKAGYFRYPPSAFKYLELWAKQLHKLRIQSKFILNKDITTWFQNKVELRWWQADAKTRLVKIVNDYTDKSILIRAPTWWWKSFYIWYLVAKLKLPTVIVAPNASVVSGIYNEVIQFIQPEYVDIIKGWKQELNLINVMHYQTFNKRFEELSWQFPLLIIDEAHYIPEKRREQINWYKNLFMLIWFTATPYRKELSFESIKKYFWETLYYWDEVEKKVLDVNVIQVKHKTDFNLNWTMDTIDKLGIDPNYQDIDRVLLYEQPERYEYVKSILDKLIENWYDKIILLADRTKYVDWLYELIKEKYDYTFKLSWQVKKDYRNKIINEMKTWKINKYILIAQSSVWTTWLDIPALQAWILAYPTKWDWTVEQAVGRVRRSSWTKKKWLWIDICDVVSIEWSKAKYKWCNDRYQKYNELWFSIYKTNELDELSFIIKRIRDGDSKKI